MKLLFVCQYFYPEQFRINDVCFKLQEAGHEVTVLTGLPNYPKGELFDGYEWKEFKEKASYEELSQTYSEIINGRYENVTVVHKGMVYRRASGSLSIISINVVYVLQIE